MDNRCALSSKALVPLADQGGVMRQVFFRRCMTVLLCAGSLCAFDQAFASGAGETGQSAAASARLVNINAPGNLASTKSMPCMDLAGANSSETPPDIHTAIKSCLDQGEFEKASRLFALAGVFARFDAQRVADPSARDAGQMLILQTFNAVTPDTKKKFSEIYTAMVKDPAMHRKLCADIQKIGPPSYFPAYMVAHGMSAFTGGKYVAEPLVPNFDANKTWADLQTVYLMCEK